MENFEDKSHLGQNKIDDIEAQEQIMFDKMFGTDEKSREEKVENYFMEVARQYDQGRPIEDSIVRLDEEARIAEKLRRHIPILIRGNWRMGKTSMALSLKTHQFGAENSLLFDAISSAKVSLEDFQKHFGDDEIAWFITKRGNPEAEFEKVEQISQQIEESQKLPFEFLNDYLLEKGEKVFLSLDEAIGLHEQPEKLKYLASLKDLSQIQLAVVLHRYASLEDSFKEIFTGFETHFVHPLTMEEVGTLIRRPLEGTSITFTPDAIKKIFEFTGGRPMEVNNFCQALMYPFSEHKKYKFTYRAEDIDELAGKEIRQLRDSFRVAIENYRRIYARSMSEEERLIIDKLIQEGEIPTSEINADTIQPLIDTTFVAKDESREVYRINGELFKRVIAERNFFE